MENYFIFQHWLGVNLKDFKQFILNQCCKWGNVFKEHLLDYVKINLNVRHFSDLLYLLINHILNYNGNLVYRASKNSLNLQYERYRMILLGMIWIHCWKSCSFWTKSMIEILTFRIYLIRCEKWSICCYCTEWLCQSHVPYRWMNSHFNW